MTISRTIADITDHLAKIYARLTVLESHGAPVKHVYGMTSPPSSSDDISQGFSQGSHWWYANGIVYVCYDPTVGAAVWWPVSPILGSMYLGSPPAAGQAVSTTPVKMTGMDTVESALNMTVDTTLDRITVDYPGAYELTYVASYTMGSNSAVTWEVYLNGSPTGIIAVGDTAPQTNEVNIVISGINTQLSATDYVEIYAYGSNTTVTMTSGQFTMRHV